MAERKASSCNIRYVSAISIQGAGAYLACVPPTEKIYGARVECGFRQADEHAAQHDASIIVGDLFVIHTFACVQKGNDIRQSVQMLCPKG